MDIDPPQSAGWDVVEASGQGFVCFAVKATGPSFVCFADERTERDDKILIFIEDLSLTIF